MTGELLPSPTGWRQTTLGASFHGATVSGEEPLRLGPSHCGQSPAQVSGQHKSSTKTERSQNIALPPWNPGARENDQSVWVAGESVVASSG